MFQIAKTNKAPEAKLDRAFRWGVTLGAVAVCVVLIAIGCYLFWFSLPILKQGALKFFTGKAWNPVEGDFGVLPLIFGTLYTSFLALLLAVPLSVGVALFLTEIGHKGLSLVVSFLVQMLAAIPSVVYGLWGVFVLVPWLRESVQVFLGEKLGFIPLFSGAPFGVGIMAAALVLAVMVVPTITAICKEVFEAVPRPLREGALALGATRWETIRIAVLKSSLSGIFGAVVLGLGRALGETMAVTMVIGNRAEISASLFSPAQTMASLLANEYAEASDPLHLAALTAVGFALFLVTFIVNFGARALVSFAKRGGGSS